MVMIQKDDLIELGFKPHQASCIIRRAKLNLVNDGFEYYNNRRLGVVPRETVEQILGVSFQSKGEILNGELKN